MESADRSASREFERRVREVGTRAAILTGRPIPEEVEFARLPAEGIAARWVASVAVKPQRRQNRFATAEAETLEECLQNLLRAVRTIPAPVRLR